VNQKLTFFQRLHDRQDFERALKNRAFIDKWLAIHWEQNNSGVDRLGIVISKRTVKHAVARNKIKRLIREAFRTDDCQKKISYNVVIRLRKNVLAAESREFRRTISRLLTKVWMTENDSPILIVHKGLSISD
jgi:ribonuclease P protein component